MNASRPSLQPSEWFLVTSLLLILLTLVIFSKIQVFRSGDELGCVAVPVAVTVLGHVAKPGTYMFDLGTPLSEVLVKVKPKLFADLRAFGLEDRVAGVCCYTIEPLTELTIWVEGACAEGELKVSPGTRICDLKKKISLHLDADLVYFKKKRRLEDKEIIKIPSKS